MKKIIVIAIAVILRIILSAVSYHSDIQHFDFAGQVLMQGHILNFYDFDKYPFNYPPAIYFSVGLLDGILTGFEDTTFHNNFLFSYQNALGNPELFLHLFLLKLPYFLFDFGTLYFLLKIFTEKREKKLVFYLWLFNPLTLYATYLIGQFDIIPVFFVTLAFYFYTKRTKNWFLYSALFIGLGAAFKIYPLFLLVPLASVLKGWTERIQVIFIGLLCYLVPILPFLPSKGFRSSALIANQSLKSLYSQIPISGGESIILFLGSLIFVYLVFLKNSRIDSLWTRSFMTLLLFFVFTHYHPQWFLWLTPFFLYEMVTNGSKNLIAILIAFFSFFMLIFFFDSGLSFGLFSPLTQSYSIAPSAVELFKKGIDLNFMRSIFQTLFVGSAVYFIYLYFPQERSD
jgi:hypothetical protein